MNKSIINKFLRPFGAEVHGLGYIEQQSKNSFKNDPFMEQSLFFEGKKVNEIIDAGANVGNVSQKYATLFPNAKIHAFEPIPEAILQFKEKHSGNDKVFLNEKGLSETAGKLTLNINKSIDTSSFLETVQIGATSDKSCETERVLVADITTVDEYCLKNNINHIDILKMDTQGSKLNILKGAEKMLSDGKISLIFTEIYFKKQYLNQPDFYDIATFLRKYDYHLKDIYEAYYNESQILWGDAIFFHSKHVKH